MIEQRAFRLLGQFQVLEHSLKIYIYFCHEITRKKLDGCIPYNHTFEQIENFPLERLAALFSRFNDNSELQKRINKLIKHRNDIAHRAMLYAHPAFAPDFGFDARIQQVKDLSTAETELETCMEQLAVDMKNVKDLYERLKA